MERMESLFRKYQDNQCSPEEIAALLQYFESGHDEVLLKTYIEQALDKSVPDDIDLEAATGEVYSRLRAQILREENTPQRRVLPLWPRVAAAAAVLLLAGAGYFYWSKPSAPSIAQHTPAAILPGSDKATLTLSNGQKIVLSSTLTGTLAQQGNTNVSMTPAGVVAYTRQGAAPADIPVNAFNTLTTRRKEQFPLVLSDGTKVWLNSSSSITYPVVFNGKERRVSITGEVYFEVQHNAAQPFRVNVNGQTIEDVGTEFNINAYEDEPVIKTTLVSGSARVIRGGHNVLLKPGQAAITKAKQDDIRVAEVDADDAAAWKNGQTLFTDEDIQTIMRQISRWYDVDVVYEGAIPDRRFEGGISRSADLSSVLKILELNNIHARIENKKIIIKP